MDFFAPASCCDTSPPLTYVSVEAGLSVTVLAPVSIVVEGATLFGRAEEDPTIEAPLISMHPFGEHMRSSGQQPPPVAAEHSIVKGGQEGGDKFSLHGKSIDFVELQHKTFEEASRLW